MDCPRQDNSTCAHVIRTAFFMTVRPARWRFAPAPKILEYGMRLCVKCLILGASITGTLGLNLHLVSLSIASDGGTTEWAPARPDAEEGEEDGA